jgi:hypothetical protein
MLKTGSNDRLLESNDGYNLGQQSTIFACIWVMIFYMADSF